MADTESRPEPFTVGETVYILGKFAVSTYAQTVLIEASISHKKGRQCVAHTSGHDYGVWIFSRKHLDSCVFKDRAKAMEELIKRKRDEHEY